MDRTRFFVGTQSRTHNNEVDPIYSLRLPWLIFSLQIHLLEYEEDAQILSAKVFDHDAEVTCMASCPANSNWLIVSSLVVGKYPQLLALFPLLSHGIAGPDGRSCHSTALYDSASNGQRTGSGSYTLLKLGSFGAPVKAYVKVVCMFRM